jgi:alpha-tubulin suppressor-like RCC1 family protein
VADWVLSPKAVLDELHWEAITAAPFYTLAIAEGGRLYYWGSRIVMNGHGYQNLSDLQLSPDTLPTQDLFAEVAGGSAYACARRVDGRLYCWGGAYSQIIDPRNEHPPLVPVGGSHTYAQIAAGDQHTCGLTTTGEIYCWGRGDDGALGNGLRGSTNGPMRVVDPAS